jgi:hypothetical protein
MLSSVIASRVFWFAASTVDSFDGRPGRATVLELTGQK